MKIINKELLDKTSALAKSADRLRMNHNFHENLNDPINRLLNAMEPGTYIRPHRHLSPPKEEIFLLLRGKAMLFIFDNDGTITDSLYLDPSNGTYGAELEAGVWHSLIVLEPDTVIYEIKNGPFAPLAEEDLAPWSPAAEQKAEVESYLKQLISHSLITQRT